MTVADALVPATETEEHVLGSKTCRNPGALPRTFTCRLAESSRHSERVTAVLSRWKNRGPEEPGAFPDITPERRGAGSGSEPRASSQIISLCRYSAFWTYKCIFLVQYPYFAGDKIGGQRRTGTHLKSPRERKAELGQEPGDLATRQPLPPRSLPWADCLQAASALTQASAHAAAGGGEEYPADALSPAP